MGGYRTKILINIVTRTLASKPVVIGTSVITTAIAIYSHDTPTYLPTRIGMGDIAEVSFPKATIVDVTDDIADNAVIPHVSEFENSNNPVANITEINSVVEQQVYNITQETWHNALASAKTDVLTDYKQQAISTKSKAHLTKALEYKLNHTLSMAQLDNVLMQSNTEINKDNVTRRININNPLLNYNDKLYLHQHRNNFIFQNTNFGYHTSRVVTTFEDDTFYREFNEYKNIKEMESLYASQNKIYPVSSAEFKKQSFFLNDHLETNGVAQNAAATTNLSANLPNNDKQADLPEVNPQNSRGEHQLFMERPANNVVVEQQEANNNASATNDIVVDAIQEDTSEHEEQLIRNKKTVTFAPSTEIATPVRESLRNLLSTETKTNLEQAMYQWKNSQNLNDTCNQTTEDQSYSLRKLEEAKKIMENDPTTLKFYWETQMNQLENRRKELDLQFEANKQVIKDNLQLNEKIKVKIQKTLEQLAVLKRKLTVAMETLQADLSFNTWLRRGLYSMALVGALWCFKKPLYDVTKNIILALLKSPDNSAQNINITLQVKEAIKDSAGVITEITKTVVNNTPTPNNNIKHVAENVINAIKSNPAVGMTVADITARLLTRGKYKGPFRKKPR